MAHRYRDRLYPGESFGIGDSNALRSDDNDNGLNIDSDGYFRVHRGNDTPATLGPGLPVIKGARFSANGHLEAFDSAGNTVWSSSNRDTPRGFLIIQNDGNVVIYETDLAGNNWSPLWKTDTNAPSGPFAAVWSAIKTGTGKLTDLANALKIPGTNFYAALLSGSNPIDGIKADVSNFQDSAKLAVAVKSFDFDSIKQIFNGNIPPAVLSAAQSGDVSAALSAAASAAGLDPSKLAALAASPGWPDAWEMVTNGGAIYDPALPLPLGRTYSAQAIADYKAGHPAVNPATKVVPLHSSPNVAMNMANAISASKDTSSSTNLEIIGLGIALALGFLYLTRKKG